MRACRSTRPPGAPPLAAGEKEGQGQLAELSTPKSAKLARNDQAQLSDRGGGSGAGGYGGGSCVSRTVSFHTVDEAQATAAKSAMLKKASTLGAIAEDHTAVVAGKGAAVAGGGGGGRCDQRVVTVSGGNAQATGSDASLEPDAEEAALQADVTTLRSPPNPVLEALMLASRLQNEAVSFARDSAVSERMKQAAALLEHIASGLLHGAVQATVQKDETNRSWNPWRTGKGAQRLPPPLDGPPRGMERAACCFLHCSPSHHACDSRHHHSDDTPAPAV